MTPDFELRFVGIVYGADFVILELFMNIYHTVFDI